MQVQEEESPVEDHLCMNILACELSSSSLNIYCWTLQATAGIFLMEFMQNALPPSAPTILCAALLKYVMFV
jgi:hypothetical protein